MAIRLTEIDKGKALKVQVSGKLAHEDYLQFVPKFELLVQQHGKLHVLLEITDFHGWDPDALVDEIKFDIKHFSDIERLALIGDQKWEEVVSRFCRPFTTAEIGYFDQSQMRGASAWLKTGRGAPVPKDSVTHSRRTTT